jgi:hypothetical protein
MTALVVVAMLLYAAGLITIGVSFMKFQKTYNKK